MFILFISIIIYFLNSPISDIEESDFLDHSKRWIFMSSYH